MNTASIHLLIGTLAAAAAVGLAWYVGRTASTITYVTLADGRRQERGLPLLFRLLLPWAPNLAPYFLRSRFDRSRKQISDRVIAAGFEDLLRPEEYLSLRLLVPLFILPVSGLTIFLFGHTLPGRIGFLLAERGWMLVLMFVLWGYVFPSQWLRSALKARHQDIERSLPFVMDLMTLSVEAGLDFMTAIQRIVERSKLDALVEELVRVLREVQLGRTRREALRRLADRSKQVDLRSVVNALVQADELGVSIGAMLRIQSDQMRGRRFQRAEKAANEAPVKLLFPLVAFIFPCVFIVLLGPVILEFLKQGF